MSGRGGTRPGSGRKPYPDFRPAGVVIDVRDTRAYVSRWQRSGSQFWLEEAQNWNELEDAAALEIQAAGGSITMSGIYPCSPELIDQAEFSEQPPVGE